MKGASSESMPLLPSTTNFVNDKEIWLQHDDPDVIIPDHISWYLVVSAHLFLVIAIFAFVYSQFVLGVFSLGLYLTSLWHWHKPRFSSYARKADYCAVLSVVIYASYIAFNDSSDYKITWFVGLAGICLVFTTNEYCYYVQVMKSVSGKPTDVENAIELRDREDSCIPVTHPNTREREMVYWRTVIVHMLGVHIMGFALASVIIVVSFYFPDSY